MIIGFTGTQEELPAAQVSALGFLLGGIRNAIGIVEVHHGDCVGADAAFDRCCVEHSFVRHAHPGPHSAKRAYCEADVIHEERPFLARNKEIVDLCDVLVACPRGGEVRRSGTWSTVRYARKHSRRIIFVWPNGDVTEEGS